MLICGGLFEYDKKCARLEEINQIEALDGFWEDTEQASKIQKEKSVVETIVGQIKKLQQQFDDYELLVQYAKEGDLDSAEEAKILYQEILANIVQQEQNALLFEEMDFNNAIVSINAGAGGTESCDWAAMLLRMVVRWNDSKGFKAKILDYQDGDSAGIKSATLMVEGQYAYGLLKSETGIHRLVRISPFDANSRRHTSFASIFVSPEIDDSIDIQVLDKDIKIDVYRAGGAGGQSVNTTDSAVRITHFPSGIVVTCQNERSQLQNKMMAMKILKSRLFDKAMEEKRAKQNEIEASKMEIGWGSQIRSYVLHPYKLVKDHRTGHESSNAEKILDGDLDDFIKSYLQWNALKGKQ